MQQAMKTLAYASTSLTTRVGALERAIESERLKSLESSSRLLGRIKTLESRLEGSHMQTPGRVASEHRDDREGQPTNVEQWCAFEARIRLELDAGRADAAAARAAASWRGVSDDLRCILNTFRCRYMEPRLIQGYGPLPARRFPGVRGGAAYIFWPAHHPPSAQMKHPPCPTLLHPR